MTPPRHPREVRHAVADVAVREGPPEVPVATRRISHLTGKMAPRHRPLPAKGEKAPVPPPPKEDGVEEEEDSEVEGAAEVEEAGEEEDSEETATSIVSPRIPRLR